MQSFRLPCVFREAQLTTIPLHFRVTRKMTLPIPLHGLQRMLSHLESPVVQATLPPKSGFPALESPTPTRGSRQFLRATGWNRARRPVVFAVAYLFGVWITLADMEHFTLMETASYFSATISEVVTSAGDAFRANGLIRGR